MGGGVWLDKSVTYWVSNQGNDKTADGSQEKPFATLSALLTYIHRRVFNPAFNITIDFLTDYEEAGLESKSYVLSRSLGGYSAPTLRIQNSLGKDVKLSRFLVTDNACVWLKDVTIVTTNGICCYANYNGRIVLDGSLTFEQKNTDLSVIQALKGGTVIINSNAVLNIGGTAPIHAIIYAADGGKFFHVNTAITPFTININSDITSVFSAQRGGIISNLNQCVINNSNEHAVTYKAICTGASMIYTGNRGYEWIPGNETNIDETSHFI